LVCQFSNCVHDRILLLPFVLFTLLCIQKRLFFNSSPCYYLKLAILIYVKYFFIIVSHLSSQMLHPPFLCVFWATCLGECYDFIGYFQSVEKEGKVVNSLIASDMEEHSTSTHVPLMSWGHTWLQGRLQTAFSSREDTCLAKQY
jgi:hypothetical protein